MRVIIHIRPAILQHILNPIRVLLPRNLLPLVHGAGIADTQEHAQYVVGLTLLGRDVEEVVPGHEGLLVAGAGAGPGHEQDVEA